MRQSLELIKYVSECMFSYTKSWKIVKNLNKNEFNSFDRRLVITARALRTKGQKCETEPFEETYFFQLIIPI